MSSWKLYHSLSCCFPDIVTAEPKANLTWHNIVWWLLIVLLNYLVLFHQLWTWTWHYRTRCGMSAIILRQWVVKCNFFQVRMPIPIPMYLKIGFLTSSTVTLLDIWLILKPCLKTFLIDVMMCWGVINHTWVMEVNER